MKCFKPVITCTAFLTLSLAVTAEAVEELAICAVEATTDDGNVAANAIDGDLSTRWSGKSLEAYPWSTYPYFGRQLALELCEPADLSHIEIAWYKGDERTPYFNFRTLTAPTADNRWTYANVEEEHIFTTDFLPYTLEAENIVKIQVWGYGNSMNAWNSINELKVYGTPVPKQYDLEPVTNLEIVNETATRVTLSWDDNNTDIDGYLVERAIGEDDLFSLARTQTETTAGFHNMDRDTLHRFRVSPFKDGEQGPGVIVEAQFEFYNGVITPVSAEASSDDGNVASNAIDGDLSTRWSALGDGEYITFDLGKEHVLDAVEIAWYKGDQRQANFRVECSDDNQFFYGYEDYEGHVSSGTTADYEVYQRPLTTVCDGDDNVRYVRIEGYGNSQNDWNSISDIRFIGALSEISE